MRHIVSYAEGGHIQLAIVDIDSGELNQIGQFIWPDGFGLPEAGVLVANLSEFFKLNGSTPRPKAVAVATQPALPPAPTPPVDGRIGQAESASRDVRVLTYIEEHPGCTVRDIGDEFGIDTPSNSWIGKSVRRLTQRGVLERRGVGGNAGEAFTYTASPRSSTRYGNKRAKAKPENRVLRHIPDTEVLAIIDQYPEGVTAREIGAHIWRTKDGKDSDEPCPRWVTRSVENRLNMMQYRDRDGKATLPFRVEYREDGGTRNGLPSKYVRPL